MDGKESRTIMEWEVVGKKTENCEGGEGRRVRDREGEIGKMTRQIPTHKVIKLHRLQEINSNFLATKPIKNKLT